MADDPLRYDALVEGALRGVVRQVLESAVEHGLPGDHHFYITFRTDRPDVEIPDHLRERYPDEMTIVLQHQFWGLKVDGRGFEVKLSFAGAPHRLAIPFAAIVAFADPSVQFALQFESGELEAQAETPAEPAEPPAAPAAEDGQDDAEPSAGDKVITLDSFRKR